MSDNTLALCMGIILGLLILVCAGDPDIIDALVLRIGECRL